LMGEERLARNWHQHFRNPLGQRPQASGHAPGENRDRELSQVRHERSVDGDAARFLK
jgi:hypothetical protein